jgi:hypothetical protein
MKTMRTAMAASAAAAIALAIGGCASTHPVPADKLARSQGAVMAAEQMNAGADPDSALYLKFAHEQMADAKRQLVNGNSERASYVLLRAEADADVAMSYARAKSAADEAQKTLGEVQQLKAQISTTEGSQP